MFCPTRICADSLSSVSNVGVDRMFALTCDSSARARNARLVIVPRPGMLTVPRITPRFKPWAAAPGFTAMSMMLLLLVALRAPKLVPPTTRVCVVL